MITLYNADTKTEKLIKTVYKAALKYFNQKDIFALEISIVSARKIRKTNCEERGVDAVTDVLSFPALEINKILPVTKKQFPYDIDYDSGKLILGDTLMCMERIKAQAKEYGHSEEREAAYLFLHSLLHLFGYDHMTDEDKAEMREKEEAILTPLGIVRNI